MAHGLGHVGRDKTFEIVARSVFWPRSYKDVSSFVRKCHYCQRNKHESQLPAGLLQPQKVPARCWQTITADFLTKLPTTPRGFNSILVMVDKLSKRMPFLPATDTLTSPNSLQLLLSRVFVQHGVPEIFISDLDPLFTAYF